MVFITIDKPKFKRGVIENREDIDKEFKRFEQYFYEINDKLLDIKFNS
jgi:hypothetical protein